MNLSRKARGLAPLCWLLATALSVSVAAAQSAPSGAAEELSDAQTVSTARDIQGMSVWDRKNELLGEVGDVILDQNTAELRLVVISHGGFLGIGSKDVAIEWAEIDYDAGARLLRTRSLTADDLKDRAPYQSDKGGVSIDDVQ